MSATVCVVYDIKIVSTIVQRNQIQVRAAAATPTTTNNKK